MATKLRNLKIDEGSLVDKGANQEAHIVLFKRDGTEKIDGPDIDDIAGEVEAVTAGIADFLEKAGRKISGSRMSMMKEMKSMMDKASGLMQSMMDEASGEPTAKAASCEECKDQNTTACKKCASNKDKVKKGSDSMPISDEVRKNLDDNVQSYLAELEGKVATLEKADKEPEDIWKGVDLTIKKRFEEMEDRTNKAEEIAKAEREKRIAKEYEDKAKEYPLMGSVDDVAKMLRSAYDISEESGKQLEETFKAANEKLTANDVLTKELGKSAGDSDVEGKLDALAKKLSIDEGISYEKAYTKVLDTSEGRALYKELNSERGVA